MHIVILSDDLPPEESGGAGRVAWQLGQGLQAAGHRVTFVTSTREKARTETRHGFTVHLLHSSYASYWQAWFGLMNPQTVWPLNKLLRRLEPDVVNAHDVHIHLGYHSLVIGRFAGAATVFTAQDVMPFAYGKLTPFADHSHAAACEAHDYRLPLGYNARRMGLRWNPARNLSIRHTMTYYTDARIAISHELKKALEANQLPPFQVVHNGVDSTAFNAPASAVSALRQRLRLEGRRVILFGGRLDLEKGEEQLMAALRRVKRQVPDVALLVMARSSDAMQRLLRGNPDLAQHVVGGGWLEGRDLAAAYRLAHVVATPSVCFDPFPMMNLEGMAAGSVPVTTCFGGAREAVIDGETGFVVNPYDCEALADRLSRLLVDEDLRQRMARAGREQIRYHFTPWHQAEATLEVYQDAIARRHRSH